VDSDDDQFRLPGERSVPRGLTRDGAHLYYFGTYTPPAPYRVFRLIPGGGLSTGPGGGLSTGPGNNWRRVPEK
jgi:hypothetical protein